MEKYSVLMSVYKNEKAVFFRRALDSMLNQTIPPEEIVIVEDGPLTDELYEALKEYREKNPSLYTTVVNEKNLGLGPSLEKGLLSCRNELVARMDTDDVAFPHRCEEQLRYFEKSPELDLVGGDISEFIGEEDHVVAYRRVPQSDSDIREYIKTRCPFNHMTVMYKKSAVIEAGNYKDLFWNEDYYLWIRMLLKGAVFGNTGTVLVNVRVGEDMYKRRGGDKYFKSEKYLQDFMRKNKIIGFKTYFMNVLKRFVVQRLLPNRLRGWVFRTFARTGSK